MTGPRTIARTVLTAVLWTALGLGVGLVVALTVPNLAGYRTLTVLSGSMEPSIRTGDVLVSHWISPEQARVGDVVTFREPGGERLYTHRVRSVRVKGGTARLVTKGDANNTPERWHASTGGRIARAEYRVPKAGYVVQAIAGRYGRIGLIVVPALALAAWELARIWRPRRTASPREVLGGSDA